MHAITGPDGLECLVTVDKSAYTPSSLPFYEFEPAKWDNPLLSAYPIYNWTPLPLVFFEVIAPNDA